MKSIRSDGIVQYSTVGTSIVQLYRISQNYQILAFCDIIRSVISYYVRTNHTKLFCWQQRFCLFYIHFDCVAINKG